MFGGDFFTFKGVGHECFIGRDVGQRHISGVPEFSMFHDVSRFRLHACHFEKIAHSHPGPSGIEFAPFGDAVNVERQRHARQSFQFIKSQSEGTIDQTKNV